MKPAPPGRPAHPDPSKTCLDTVWAEGPLELADVKTGMGDAGSRLRAARVEPYIEKKSK